MRSLLPQGLVSIKKSRYSQAADTTDELRIRHAQVSLPYPTRKARYDSSSNPTGWDLSELLIIDRWKMVGRSRSAQFKLLQMIIDMQYVGKSVVALVQLSKGEMRLQLTAV